MKKRLYEIVLAVFLIGTLILTSGIHRVQANGTIYIRADGSIDPPTAPISTLDNITYMFTATIYDPIVVERDNITIDGIGCTLQGAVSGTGFYLYYMRNVTIKNTNIKGFHRGIWQIHHSDNNTICENNVTNNDFGIVLAVSSNNSIFRNNIANNVFGVEVGAYSNDNSIFENNVTSNDYGVWLATCSNNNIVGNNVTNNLWGILLGTYCNNSSIALNNIGNNGEGIVLGPSGNYSITENNIADNVWGIRLYSCFDSMFCHNNFISNTMQIVFFSPGSMNIWDNGYPSGGNYWSDYAGLDLQSGTYQNEAGSDGIGDTPYVIDGDNRDNFPLSNPWVPTETSITLAGKNYPVSIVSNTTLEQIVATANTLHFKSSGLSGETGYCNVIFPMVNTTDLKVFVDGQKLAPPPFPVINSNGTHYFIYFEFTLSTHTVAIQFAPSAPEVPVGGEWAPIQTAQAIAPYALLAFITLAALATGSWRRLRKH